MYIPVIQASYCDRKTNNGASPFAYRCIAHIVTEEFITGIDITAAHTAKLHRIPLDVSNEMYDRIKAAADAQGRSVNNFIKFHLENVLKSYESMNNRTW